eukprot:6283944-Pyramimonas_sp.AAC.1
MQRSDGRLRDCPLAEVTEGLPHCPLLRAARDGSCLAGVVHDLDVGCSTDSAEETGPLYPPYSVPMPQLSWDLARRVGRGLLDARVELVQLPLPVAPRPVP